MKKTIILLYWFAISCTMAQAQSYINEDLIFENFAYSVKQMSEFMRRFNLQEVIIKPEQDSLWRYKNRVFLFDKNSYLENSKVADEMISQIEKDNITIHFRDTLWQAIAKCNVLYQGKKDSLLIILKPEQIRGDVYKWSIVDVQGSIVSLHPKSKNEQIRISPVDNELEFISLSSITTTNAKNIILFSKNGYKTDRLTVFNAYVYAGILKVLDVKALTYQLNQVKGFEFYVSYFNREDKNSGWLISKINKIPDIPNNQKDNIENKLADATALIKHFYKMLSTYALHPENPTLAKQITSMFIEPNKKNAFLGVASIYDDIDYFINKYPETMINIKTYLTKLESPKNKKWALRFIPKEIKQVRETQNTRELVYNLEIQSETDKQLKYMILLAATIKENKIISISPIIQE